MIEYVFGLDPGSEKSAVVVYRVSDGDIGERDIMPNDELLEWLRTGMNVTPISPRNSALVIEQIESFGMAVGREVFETVFWSGRFFEMWRSEGGHVDRITRKAVKVHLCNQTRARDSEVAQAVRDRYGPTREAAVGTKKNPGPLFGVKSHLYAALAVAIAWSEGADKRSQPRPYRSQ